MNYFNENKTKDIKVITNEFKRLNNPNGLFNILINLYDVKTCAPRLRKFYSLYNPCLGQCSITSFLVQDIFGGEVYGVPLKDGNYHCFNYINGIMFDLTSSQFKDELIYNLDYPQSRDIHFKKEEKYQRYLCLKKRLLNKLGEKDEKEES